MQNNSKSQNTIAVHERSGIENNSADYLDIEKISKLVNPKVADAAIALDFLLAVKNGVRTCAIALTETATPEARTLLRNLLEEGIAMHEKISHLMIRKGWLYPYEVNKQFQLDIQSAETTLTVAGMKLWPDNTSRLGMYASPMEGPEGGTETL